MLRKPLPPRRSAMAQTLALVGLCLSMPFGPAAAADDLCGATVVTDLRLDQDLTCTGDGLTIGADGITMNLDGFTIRGSGTGIGISVTGRRDVSIKGGTVANFETGVRITNSSSIEVKDSEFRENGDGVDIQSGSIGNTVKANEFWDNRARGIMLRGNSTMNMVKDNTFTRNRVGILMFGPLNSTIKSNTVSQSALAGIRINVLATGNLVLDNTALSNPAGIEFIVTPTGSAVGNALIENTVAMNVCGLKGPTDGNTLKENVFEANGTDTCP